MMKERYDLLKNRIEEITKENQVMEPYCSYFKQVALFLMEIFRCFEQISGSGGCESGENAPAFTQDLAGGFCEGQDLQALLAYNHKLYQDILPENYETSYGNPAYAVKLLGEQYGQLLCMLYGELYALIPIAFEGAYKKEESLFEILIRGELFVEVYCSFCRELEEEKRLLPPESLKEMIYWFVSDYSEEEWEKRTKEKLNPAENFAYTIINNSNLDDPSYLFAYGEYISENQIKTAQYMAKLDEKTLKLMADTYTEGYRIGFIKGNKDISKKKVVNIVYPLGFEKMIKLAIANFEAMGLRPAIMRTAHSIFYKNGMGISGFYSDSPNKQFDFDHKEDQALILDKKLINRKLEAVENAHEAYRELAKAHGGPAWVEVFGEKPFVPCVKKEAPAFDEKQQKLEAAYRVKSSQLINEYIPGEERSFTIIAFPVPEIGTHYEEIMQETIALNTLDYETYESIQQVIIDTLDLGEYVIVRGMGENRTNLKVALYPLRNPEKETIFENCVADVNIPVGEVFTSPVLKGTEGILHVTKVYLSQLEYKDLSLTFADGMVTDYSCSNFSTKEENKKYIRDNILFHHESLPMGEFAIGTNTTAYVMARKYHIQDKLPILIGEKTGPHFAVGDTCYSHGEEVAVFNPDGKEIVARDNEISLLRKTDVERAYFGCHTDITIPYDELGEVSVVTREGKVIPVILDGRFVLKGTEGLNEAFGK
ncbi:MAG: aminopeptidase [Roseburia sp.]|nr:aminopeptidase [Roseburia sp.]MCM1279768.1 aminopeptidase [Robinsoniella sp.]